MSNAIVFSDAKSDAAFFITMEDSTNDTVGKQKTLPPLPSSDEENGAGDLRSLLKDIYTLVRPEKLPNILDESIARYKGYEDILAYRLAKKYKDVAKRETERLMTFVNDGFASGTLSRSESAKWAEKARAQIAEEKMRKKSISLYDSSKFFILTILEAYEGAGSEIKLAEDGAHYTTSCQFVAPEKRKVANKNEQYVRLKGWDSHYAMEIAKDPFFIGCKVRFKLSKKSNKTEGTILKLIGEEAALVEYIDASNVKRTIELDTNDISHAHKLESPLDIEVVLGLWKVLDLQHTCAGFCKVRFEVDRYDRHCRSFRAWVPLFSSRSSETNVTLRPCTKPVSAVPPPSPKRQRRKSFRATKIHLHIRGMLFDLNEIDKLTRGDDETDTHARNGDAHGQSKLESVLDDATSSEKSILESMRSELSRMSSQDTVHSELSADDSTERATAVVLDEIKRELASEIESTEQRARTEVEARRAEVRLSLEHIERRYRADVERAMEHNLTERSELTSSNEKRLKKINASFDETHDAAARKTQEVEARLARQLEEEESKWQSRLRCVADETEREIANRREEVRTFREMTLGEIEEMRRRRRQEMEVLEIETEERDVRMQRQLDAAQAEIETIERLHADRTRALLEEKEKGSNAHAAQIRELRDEISMTTAEHARKMALSDKEWRDKLDAETDALMHARDHAASEEMISRQKDTAMREYRAEVAASAVEAARVSAAREKQWQENLDTMSVDLVRARELTLDEQKERRHEAEMVRTYRREIAEAASDHTRTLAASEEKWRSALDEETRRLVSVRDELNTFRAESSKRSREEIRAAVDTAAVDLAAASIARSESEVLRLQHTCARRRARVLRKLGASRARLAAIAAANAATRDCTHAVELAMMSTIWGVYDRDRDSERDLFEQRLRALTLELNAAKSLATARQHRYDASATIVDGANSALRQEMARRIYLQGQLNAERALTERAVRRIGACPAPPERVLPCDANGARKRESWLWWKP
eukprot:g1620.t1